MILITIKKKIFCDYMSRSGKNNPTELPMLVLPRTVIVAVYVLSRAPPKTSLLFFLHNERIGHCDIKQRILP